jgi:hypothetical protein
MFMAIVFKGVNSLKEILLQQSITSGLNFGKQEPINHER